MTEQPHESDEGDSDADPDSSRVIERARRIVMEFGRNATAYQVLNRGFKRWFLSSKAGTSDEALVGYVRYNNTGVAAGEPVCPEQRSDQAAHAFERAMKEQGASRVCWFCASLQFASIFEKDPDYASILIGAQPVWNPQQWSSKIRLYSSLRKQLNRAWNKGVEVTEWPIERAHNHPALARCLSEWLEARPFAPLHFLVESQTLDRLYDRRVFVAERAGTPIGFVILSPIPLRHGWLVEQIIRSKDAPNGTSEVMLNHAVTTIGLEGYNYVTLGLAPLSTRAGIPSDNPPWIRFLLGWVRLHGRRFYNFDGLDYFKAKFVPDLWEPIFAVVNEPRFSIRTFYAVASAFSNGTPVRAMAIGSLKALRQEFRWLRQRLRSGRE